MCRRVYMYMIILGQV